MNYDDIKKQRKPYNMKIEKKKKKHILSIMIFYDIKKWKKPYNIRKGKKKNIH